MGVGKYAIPKGNMILDALDEATRESVLRQAVERRCPRGSTIFIQGEPARHFFVVLDGWVKLFRTSPDGAEAVVNTMSRGQTFAAPPALRGMTYPVTAEAASDCRVLSIPGEAVRRLMAERPELAIHIVADVFEHLQSLVRQIEQLKARSSTQRVAALLLELAPQGATRATVTLPYEKALVAARLGMTPESLSRAFSSLRRHGIRVERDKVHLDNIPNLSAFARDEAA